MKDLKPEEEAEFIEMLVPIGLSPDSIELTVETADQVGNGVEEEAPPPSAFTFERWDD
jgi:hypothetical protein